MKRGIKKRDHEKLDSANISRVIGLLEPADATSKPITKKEACQLLNISYNTTRLGRIIAEHKERTEFVAKRKQQNRGKPASQQEITEAVTDYLTGDTISDIATRLFRSPGFVKAIIERIGVPSRPTGDDRRRIGLIPDACSSEEFRPGDIVWSAQYHRTAIVNKELTNMDYEEMYGGKAYQIYVLEPVDSEGSYFPHIETGGFNAVSIAYDLGSLSHLEKYGVDLTRL